MLSDIEIAQAAKLKPVQKIAASIGIKETDLELYGKYKAKVLPTALKKIKTKRQAKYVLVTAITPTPLGEGKTVTTIGLSMALNRIGKKAIACIRQPSLGPVFGIKGGAAGGGYSQVVPMEDFNLHLTGDVHAVGLAHNLCAAFLENALFRKKLNIDHKAVFWRRVLDVSDRSLRKISVGLDDKVDGVYPRETGFDITVASEIMAILALSSDLQDLRRRLGRIVLAKTFDGKYVTPEDLKVAGSMAALLKDAVHPNLMQTLDNTPVFVHAGPFANIAHGNSSIIADKIAVSLADFVVTEAGFGADCGAEKFFDIKCRVSGLKPDAAVLVCTVRALKMHSGKFTVKPGKPLDEGLLRENLPAIREGAANLEKQIENIKIFGIPVVVTINRFSADTDKEIALIKEIAKNAGAEDAIVSDLFAKGSKGGEELAEKIVEVSKKKANFKFLYELDSTIEEKMWVIATKIYGAKDIDISPKALEQIEEFNKLGFNGLPLCMAKTHLSLSHDPELKGRPKDFVVPIREIKVSAGAGFLYALLGDMRTMPGLPSVPAGTKIDIDKDGKIVGLS
ncbi:MAG: formate--tetrahydrofolate ligase [Candidatus Omnitrophota bacterium]